MLLRMGIANCKMAIARCKIMNLASSRFGRDRQLTSRSRSTCRKSYRVVRFHRSSRSCAAPAVIDDEQQASAMLAILLFPSNKSAVCGRSPSCSRPHTLLRSLPGAMCHFAATDRQYAVQRAIRAMPQRRLRFGQQNPESDPTGRLLPTFFILQLLLCNLRYQVSQRARFSSCMFSPRPRISFVSTSKLAGVPASRVFSPLTIDS